MLDPRTPVAPPSSATTATRPKPAGLGPASTTTQELRLAIVLTGGVSLAVWMGGVCREIDLLNQASDPGGQEPADRTEDVRTVCDLYRRLLNLLDVRVSLDVLSGTSAGGINAALLGLANARRRDTGAVRKLWMDAGAFDQLLRNPLRPDPPSLLRGDEFLLSKLREAIAMIAGGPAASPRPTHVFITTTLLSAETSQFTDSYGTLIADADHHGLFHFTDDLLGPRPADEVAAPLALAARSSASFPGAFEPAYLPFGAKLDDAHPDMASYSNATAPHWASDGGLLVNRPIAPLLQEVFDRAASGQVRRVLLYIVPSSRPIQPPTPDRFDHPLNLSQALMRDLSATLNQSIAADLTAIREHNDRVAAAAETRLRLAALGSRLDGRHGAPVPPAGGPEPHAEPVGTVGSGESPAGPGSASLTVLADPAAWRDYRLRQAEWLVRPLVAAVMRAIAADPRLHSRWLATLGPGSDAEQRLRAAAGAEVVRNWPSTPPASTDQVLRAAARLGRPAYDAAKATILDILAAGYVLAEGPDSRARLAECSGQVHDAYTPAPEPDLRELVAAALATSPQGEALELPVARIAALLAGRPDAVPTGAGAGATDGPGTTDIVEILMPAWQKLAAALIGARELLNDLAPRRIATTPEAGPEPDGPVRLSLLQRRSEAAYRVRTYLDFLLARDVPVTVARLLDLHVAERSVLPVGVEVQQAVELVQVSADTRSLLDPGRRQAEDKLTGMQLHHFGAFYKGSWRANDWMWGRLDGAGWLIHLLLDPRRILSVAESAGVEPVDRAAWFLARLEEIVGPVPEASPDGFLPPRGALLAELAFLGSDTMPLPASLPELSQWVALHAQRAIAVDELATVARQIRDAGDAAPSRAEREWLADYDATTPEARADAAAVGALLASCPVPAQRLSERDQTNSPLFIRTLTQTVAVTTAAATAMANPPAFLRPTFAVARSITRGAYVATDGVHGARGRVLLTGVLLMAFGTLAMVTHNLVLGASGLVLVGAGTVMLSVALWRSIPTVLAMVVAIALLLVAAAPWLPWLDVRLFDWLREDLVPWMHEQRWAWTVLFLLVLLPPLEALIRLAPRRLRGRRLVRAVRRLNSRGAPPPVPAPRRPDEAPATGTSSRGQDG
ncbi:patatin-like protein [Rugosimonospora acidiphila]|uniref:Patatin-like protein n=1 Tax=Rugosimonospora acidiphila TaxID=556531 RepID=A0ABP9RQF6_9ACTN